MIKIFLDNRLSKADQEAWFTVDQPLAVLPYNDTNMCRLVANGREYIVKSKSADLAALIGEARRAAGLA